MQSVHCLSSIEVRLAMAGDGCRHVPAARLRPGLRQGKKVFRTRTVLLSSLLLAIFS